MNSNNNNYDTDDRPTETEIKDSLGAVLSSDDRTKTIGWGQLSDIEKNRIKRLAKLASETSDEGTLGRSGRTLMRRQNRRHRQSSLNEEFNVDVFKDVDADEIAEYTKLYPKFEDIADRPVHCTSCNIHIGTAPINETSIKMHPILRVILCKKCYTFYKNGNFEHDEEGNEYYCRWCGHGGEVSCCSKCPKVYCRRCIEHNFSTEKLKEIQNNENWICFVCNPVDMIQLKADYWTLFNFIKKQKNAIINKPLTEKELNEAMSKDSSKCCSNALIILSSKRKLSNSTEDIPSGKRNDYEKNIPEVAIKLQSSNVEDLFSSGDTNKTIVSFPQPLQVAGKLNIVSAKSTPNLVRPITLTEQPKSLLDVRTSPTTKHLIYHIKNGFRVDPNTTAPQKSYRLPNGKLIHMSNQAHQPNIGKISTSNLPKLVKLPTLSSLKPVVTPTPISILNNPPILVVPTHISSVQPSSSENKVAIKSALQTVDSSSEIDPAAKVKQNSTVVKAKSHFKLRVENSIEVCQHIIGKMKMLTKSTSFDNVETLTDVKDLIMHLSYLLTYAGSRVKTLQENCNDDLNKLGFESDNFNINSNDIEILEPSTALIDLDSDDDDKNNLKLEISDVKCTSVNESDVKAEEQADDINTESNNFITEIIEESHSNIDIVRNREHVTKIPSNANVVTIYPNSTIEEVDAHLTEDDEMYNSSVEYLTEYEPNLTKNIVNLETRLNIVNQENVECDSINQNTTDFETSNFDTDSEDYDETQTARIKRSFLRDQSSPLEIPEEKFISLFRLSKESFKFLLDNVNRKFLPLKHKSNIPPVLKLAATLRFLAEGTYQQSVGDDYIVGMAQSTVSLVIAEVLNILESVCGSFIHFDQTIVEKKKCKLHYITKTGFPGIIGFIDGTHVNIIRPTKNDQHFCNKMKQHSINVMVTCNHKLLITSVVANHGGASQDSSIWSKSLERLYLENRHRDGDKSSWLLGDSGFPLEPWLLTPYKSPIRGSVEYKFNEVHSKCRATMSRCIGLLKGRFRCLLGTRALHYKPERAAQIINVSCLLHNICILYNVKFDESLLVTDEDLSSDYTPNINISKLLVTEAKRIRDRIKKVV